MNKVIVIGCPGAGKSTFARELHKKTALPLFYLDMIWHKPDKTSISHEEFDQRIEEIVKGEQWIIDGNYSRTLPIRMKHCDTVFLLDYPLDICLNSAEERVGTKRQDLPWVETEFDEEFRQFIIEFPERKLPQIYELLEQYSDKDIYIFKTREEAAEYLEGI